MQRANSLQQTQNKKIKIWRKFWKPKKKSLRR